MICKPQISTLVFLWRFVLYEGIISISKVAKVVHNLKFITINTYFFRGIISWCIKSIAEPTHMDTLFSSLLRLLLKPEHYLCTHFLQLLNKIETSPAWVQHFPQGSLTDLIFVFRAFGWEYMPFVFPFSSPIFFS